MIPPIIGMFPDNYDFNIDFILNELNNKNPFDFEYYPKQKDYLFEFCIY